MYENFYNTMRFLIKHKEYFKLKKFLITFREIFKELIKIKLNYNYYKKLTINKLKQEGYTKEKAENEYINVEARLKYRKIYKNLFTMNKEIIKIIKTISKFNLNPNYIKPNIIIPLKDELIKYQNQLINFINEKD